MTDVAAVPGHVSTNAGSGAAKSGAAKGTGSVLDGAFAAIFGAAGGKNAGRSTDDATVKLAAQAKPDAQALDPALTAETTAEIDPQAVLADAGTKTDDASEAEAGAKSRKAGSRRKADTDPTDPQATSLVGAFAAAMTNAPQAQAVPQGKQPTISVDGVQSTTTVAPATADVAAAANIALTAKPGADGTKTDAGKDAKGAAVADTQPQTTAANNAVVTGQQNDQAPDARSGNGNDPGKDKDKSPPAQLAANDDASTTGTATSLQDIMQSLPPVLQSQLSVADVGAAGAPTVSMSDQLSNRAIDMSVSGQWIDRMAREIATLASGTGNSSFQLSPPNLGKIQIDLMQSGDKTNVRILTETDEATQRLRDGQSGLEANARVASLSLGSVSIQKSQAPSDSNRDQGQRQSPDSGNSQQQQQASAQAQNQSGQNRSGAGLNRSGFAAVMGQEQEADTGPAAGVSSVSDPGVRFA